MGSKTAAAPEVELHPGQIWVQHDRHCTPRYYKLLAISEGMARIQRCDTIGRSIGYQATTVPAASIRPGCRGYTLFRGPLNV